MHQTLIRVTCSNGRWRVSESGTRNAISCFNERQDAIEYATALAQRTEDSTLVIHGREPERRLTARS